MYVFTDPNFGGGVSAGTGTRVLMLVVVVDRVSPPAYRQSFSGVGGALTALIKAQHPCLSSSRLHVTSLVPSSTQYQVPRTAYRVPGTDDDERLILIIIFHLASYLDITASDTVHSSTLPIKTYISSDLTRAGD